VSPLTTSYADTHPQLTSLVGGPVSLSKLKDSVVALWRHIRLKCRQGCSSGSSLPHEDVAYGPENVYPMQPSAVLPSKCEIFATFNESRKVISYHIMLALKLHLLTRQYAFETIAVLSSGINLNLSGSQSLDGSQSQVGGGSSVGRGSLTRGNCNRGSVASNVSGSFGKPSTSTLASIAGIIYHRIVSDNIL